MPYFRVDDQFHSSKKVLSIPARKRKAAIGLWTIVGSWAAQQLTDGIVPMDIVRKNGGNLSDVHVLVEAGLWRLVRPGKGQCPVHGEDVDCVATDMSTALRVTRQSTCDCTVIYHDWEHYQPMSSDVRKQRAETRERVRRFREAGASGGKGKGNVTPLHRHSSKSSKQD